MNTLHMRRVKKGQTIHVPAGEHMQLSRSCQCYLLSPSSSAQNALSEGSRASHCSADEHVLMLFVTGRRHPALLAQPALLRSPVPRQLRRA